MADIKNNNGANDVSDLKGFDSEKNNGVYSSILGNDNRLPTASSSDALKNLKKNKKKRMPIAVDIIVAILLLAMIGFACFGVYQLFRLYADDYESKTVTYVFAVNNSEAVPMAESGVFYDADGNTFFFGKVKACEKKGNGMLLISVEVEAKYKEKEGYSIDRYTLAIGKSYTLYTNNIVLDGTIVELETK